MLIHTQYSPELILQAYKILGNKYKQEIVFVDKLIRKEAGYGTPSNKLQNKRSTAFGLGQFLNSTWKSTNIKKTLDPIKQISALIIYSNNRYGSVEKAVLAWNSRGTWNKKRKRYEGGWY